MLIVGVASLEKGQQQIYFLKANTYMQYSLYCHEQLNFFFFILFSPEWIEDVQAKLE